MGRMRPHASAMASRPACRRNRAVNNQGDFFDRTAFSYEPQTDTFRCPAGRTLVRKQVLTRKRSIQYVACSDCALKPRCIRVERRFVRCHLYEDALERMNARVEPTSSGYASFSMKEGLASSDRLSPQK